MPGLCMVGIPIVMGEKPRLLYDKVMTVPPPTPRGGPSSLGGGGHCLNFHFGRGGPPPGPPPSLPWIPSPPPPSTLIHLRIRVLGAFFRLGFIFSSRAFSAPIAGFFGHFTVSFLPSVADTMS